MALSKTESDHAQQVFRALRSIEFNHKNRKDSQQNFLEPLEIVATAVGLKRTFCAGLSSYYEPFCVKLAVLAGQFGLQSIRTSSVEVRIQLRAFGGHKIPHTFLSRLSDLGETEADKKIRLLWLFPDQTTELDIHAAVAGSFSLGELLGYPKCCTDGYFQLEANLIETEMEFYSKHCGAKNEDDFISRYRAWTPIEGEFVTRLEIIKNEIRTRQALSIKQFPFIHFTACRDCLNHPDSPAACQNKIMSDLAHSLNSTFARKFTTYSNNYFDQFQRLENS